MRPSMRDGGDENYSLMGNRWQSRTFRAGPLLQTVRVSSNPFFLASVLAVYQQRHTLDDVALAAVLGCSLNGLTDLHAYHRSWVSSRWTVGRT